ncbi:hypothetical protein [Croceibacterium aestuarii]|uniref:hypothetical protein n=1 Tax=Croceibacterium aestuarii TaxID=3064139 RepID=UPI00272E22E0|nr:hypothetical protein [Croceibacterium sp. D39]
MFLRSILCATAIWGAATAATAEETSEARIADEITQLSSGTCFGIISGEIAMPALSAKNSLDESIEKVESWGLSYGFSKEIAGKPGAPGLALVSRSTMGSKSLLDTDIVFAVGGSQPGCHVILLSEPSLSVTDSIARRLVEDGWRYIKEMTARRGALERRAFIRRDSEGQDYLMNLMTVLSPVRGTKMRLFTTTAKIPPQVRIPEGY